MTAIYQTAFSNRASPSMRKENRNSHSPLLDDGRVMFDLGTYQLPRETRDNVQLQGTVADKQTTKDKKKEPASPNFDSPNPYSPQTIWDNDDYSLKSQRSSPTPLENEDPWVLPSPQIASSTNDTMFCSPSLEGLSPRYGDPYDEDYSDLSDCPTYTALGERVGRQPIGQRPSKVKSNLLFSCKQRPPSGAPRNGLGLDNTAREHPLYHNVSPKDDGLYHCPFEDDPKANCPHKPEKFKCNYDKFVDSHLRPYRCKVLQCGYPGFSSMACLLRHEREAHAMHGHGDKPYCCTYEGCERGVPGNGFPRHWNLRDHMKRVHNDPGSLKRTSESPSPKSPKGRKRKAGENSPTLVKRFEEKCQILVETVTKLEDPYEQYKENYQTLVETVTKLEDPRNPKTMALLHNASDCMKMMIQATQRINSAS